jgi:hypothetical protein
LWLLSGITFKTSPTDYQAIKDLHEIVSTAVQGNLLKLQRCAAADAEQEQANESGQNRDAPPGIAAVPEIPQLLWTVHSFEQGQLKN